LFSIIFRKNQNGETLAQKLEKLEETFATNPKIKQRYDKFFRMAREQEEEAKLKTEVLAFKYATDLTFMRRSSKSDMERAVIRREAWATGTFVIPAVYVLLYYYQIIVRLIDQL
jgi:2-oxoglutarate dehydrogenase complex dehydrogenase (E1) component-like enzyme